jgi:hypothetical protein
VIEQVREDVEQQHQAGGEAQAAGTKMDGIQIVRE